MNRMTLVCFSLVLSVGLLSVSGCGSGDSVPGKMGKAPVTRESNLPSAANGSTRGESNTDPSAPPASGEQSPTNPPAGPTPPAGENPSGPAPSQPPAEGPNQSAPPGRPSVPPAGGATESPTSAPTSTSKDGAYTLKITAKPGESIKYRTTSKMTMDLGSMASMLGEKGKKPIEFSATTDMQRKFTRVSPDGFAVEETVLDVKTSEGAGSGVMGMMGQGMKQAKGSKATTEYDASGRVKPTAGKPSVSSGGDLASMSGLVGFQGMIMPNRPIKVGDTWDDKIDFQKMMNSMSPGGARFKMSPVPVKTTFVRIEDVGGIKVGVFNVVIDAKPSMEANAEKTPMKMNFALASQSTVKIDLRTGIVRESTGTYRNKISMGSIPGPKQPGMPNSVTMTQVATVTVKRI